MLGRYFRVTTKLNQTGEQIVKNVIVITGASSGFGALAARALAKAGHTVYASMRETKGRNAPEVKELEKYAAEHSVDLRSVELDVSSEKSCETAIQEIIAKDARLDDRSQRWPHGLRPGGGIHSGTTRGTVRR